MTTQAIDILLKIHHTRSKRALSVTEADILPLLAESLVRYSDNDSVRITSKGEDYIKRLRSLPT